MNASAQIEQKKHSVSMKSREKLDIDGVIPYL